MFHLDLDNFASAASSVLTEALKNNTSLTNVQLRIKTFDIADVHDFRTALRLNTALTTVSFELGGIQLDTTKLLPLGDRRKLRTVLSLNAPEQSDGTVDLGDVRFYVLLSDVSIGRQLGSGHFGAVSEGTCRGQPVCIKRFLQHYAASGATNADDEYHSRSKGNYVVSADEIDRRQAAILMQINELALLIEFGDAGSGQQLGDVLKQTCVFATHFSIDQGDLLVIMPFMAGGVLESALKTATAADCVRWMCDVAEALRQLHAAGFAHRDVASRNVLLDLIDGVLTAKLCDFGLSCALEAPWLPDLVPVGIWPPEAVLSPSASSYQLGGDVWAFGLMLVDALRAGQVCGSVAHEWVLSPAHSQPELSVVLDQLFSAFAAPIIVATDAVLTAASTVTDYKFIEGQVVVAPAATAQVVCQLPSDFSTSMPPEEYYVSRRMHQMGGLADPVAALAQWRERLLIPGDALDRLPLVLGTLLPVLVQWCVRAQPEQRPSMEVVALLLRQACVGRLELNALPEQIVPHRLKELHWTFGDGVFLGAICRGRGTPLGMGDEIDLNKQASDGGAQILGGLLYSQQVRLLLCALCACLCL